METTSKYLFAFISLAMNLFFYQQAIISTIRVFCISLGNVAPRQSHIMREAPRTMSKPNPCANRERNPSQQMCFVMRSGTLLHQPPNANHPSLPPSKDPTHQSAPAFYYLYISQHMRGSPLHIGLAFSPLDSFAQSVLRPGLE